MSRPLQFGIPSFDVLFAPGLRQGDTAPRRERRNEDKSREPGSPDYGGQGIRVAGEGVASMCLIGPDGTGKSIFGMHLAAQYAADLEIPKDKMYPKDNENQVTEALRFPRILYVSTDLKFAMAEKIWSSFKLDYPNQRVFPFHWGNAAARKHLIRRVELKKLDPARLEKAELDNQPKETEVAVYFVDLMSRSMGDDWSFVNRLLALLDSRSKLRDPHLIVIDAVEGFETLVGDRDAFGEATSRRSRIVQIMRSAADKCHVCLIVEEPRAEARFPEEFVTDVVVRFRATPVGNYVRRTLEIEKSRGQPHVRGQHPFVIRMGGGSTTGKEPNPDDPKVNHAYVNVYPSLHLLSREEMKSRGPANPKRDEKHVAAFGIRYLDRMLLGLPKLRDPALRHGFDRFGLKTQTATALIGEAATQTTALATAFLARTFRAYVFQLADAVQLLTEAPGKATLAWAKEICFANKDWRKSERARANEIPSLIEKISHVPTNRRPISRRAKEIMDEASTVVAALPQSGAAVLLTTSNQDCARLTEQFEKWLGHSRFEIEERFDARKWSKEFRTEIKKTFWETVRKHMTERTICRRLELHDLASPILLQICQQAVKKAQERVIQAQEQWLGKTRERTEDTKLPTEEPLPGDRRMRFRSSWNIRVVLDDLNTLKTTYPEIRGDPIFLLSLLQFLELEGVTSLIVDCQNGRPDAVLSDAFDQELRALVPHALLTWRVPFFGSMRDAIMMQPSYPEGTAESVVREVITHPEEVNKPLFVDPELELYSGLEKGEPQPIPLEVQLFAEESSMTTYIAEENENLARLFTPLEKNGPQKVLVGVGSNQYDALHDFCNLQTNTRLGHTMVFQVDEFWATDRKRKDRSEERTEKSLMRREGALYTLYDYLFEKTSEAETEPKDDVSVSKVKRLPFSDRYGVFSGPPIMNNGSAEVSKEDFWRRMDFFRHSLPWKKRRRNASVAQTLKSEYKVDESAFSQIDRIPFAWDFGFLLCPKSIWESARNMEFEIGPEGNVGQIKNKVGDIWDRLPKAPSEIVDKKDGKAPSYVSWREFLGASRVVARGYAQSGTPIPVLDVSTTATESLLCLVLEVWASEIADMKLKKGRKEQKQFFERLNHVDWRSEERESLEDWLLNYKLAFYKACLLLAESLPLGTLTEEETIPRLRARPASGNAAATRHWYKTACSNQAGPVKGELSIPVRLPGHFSVRGDWFLAVAWGSRSERLGWRALDLLSTRRANFRRLQLGIGLPTRDVVSQKSARQLPTALGFRKDNNQVVAISYADLVGSVNPSKKYLSSTNDGRYFNWLWRSQLQGYHRQSRLLHNWVAQIVAFWRDPKNQSRLKWADGFAAYDALNKESNIQDAQKLLEGVPSWEEFKDLCDLLREQLQIAAGRRSY